MIRRDARAEHNLILTVHTNVARAKPPPSSAYSSSSQSRTRWVRLGLGRRLLPVRDAGRGAIKRGYEAERCNCFHEEPFDLSRNAPGPALRGGTDVEQVVMVKNEYGDVEGMSSGSSGSSTRTFVSPSTMRCKFPLPRSAFMRCQADDC